MEQATAAAAAACAWCAATQPDVKLLRCGGCRQKFFCDNDKACLKHAWKSGHKQECKELQARRQQQQQKAAAPQLPAAMKTIPAWATGGGGTSTARSSAAGAMFSDSFDGQPNDEDDKCGICAGEPMPRSGRGVCALKCSHRFHSACVAQLRARLVECPCTFCASLGVASSVCVCTGLSVSCVRRGPLGGGTL